MATPAALEWHSKRPDSTLAKILEKHPDWRPSQVPGKCAGNCGKPVSGVTPHSIWHITAGAGLPGGAHDRAAAKRAEETNKGTLKPKARLCL